MIFKVKGHQNFGSLCHGCSFSGALVFTHLGDAVKWSVRVKTAALFVNFALIAVRLYCLFASLPQAEGAPEQILTHLGFYGKIIRGNATDVSGRLQALLFIV